MVTFAQFTRSTFADTDNKKLRRLKPDAVPTMFLPGQDVESEGKKTVPERPSIGAATITDRKSVAKYDRSEPSGSYGVDKDEEVTTSPSAEESCQVVDDGGTVEYPESTLKANGDHDLNKPITRKGSGYMVATLPPLGVKDDAIEHVATFEGEENTSKAGEDSPMLAEDSSEPELDLRSSGASRPPKGNGHLDQVLRGAVNKSGGRRVSKSNMDAGEEESVHFGFVGVDGDIDEDATQDDSGQDDEEHTNAVCEPGKSTARRGAATTRRAGPRQGPTEEHESMETDSQDSTREVAAIFEQTAGSVGAKRFKSSEILKVRSDDEVTGTQKGDGGSKHQLGSKLTPPVASQKAKGGEGADQEPAIDNVRRSLRNSGLKRYNEMALDKPGPAKKLAIDEIKSQARMKYSPRKVDLAKGESTSPSTSPAVLMNKRNVQVFLSSYGDLVAQEVTQKLALLGKAQTTLFNKMFDKITTHSILMDRLHKEISCRMNSCKYANSVRHAAVQVVAVPPCAPSQRLATPTAVQQTVQMAPPQQQTMGVAPQATQLARHQQQQQHQVQQTSQVVPGGGAVRQVTPPGPTTVRGRPRLTPPVPRSNTPILNAALQHQSAPPAAAKPAVDANAVIDLTDDEPARVRLAPPPGRAAPVPPRPASSAQTTASPRAPETLSPNSAIPVGGIVPAGALRAIAPKPIQQQQLQQPRGPTIAVRASVPAGGVASVVPTRLRMATPAARAAAPAATPRGATPPATQVTQRVRPAATPTATTAHASQTATTVPKPPHPPTTGTILSGTGSTPAVQLPPDIIMRPVQVQPTKQQTKTQPQTNGNNCVQVRRNSQARPKHPAPLPPTPTYTDQGTLSTPPAPIIQQIKRTAKGIVVTFDAERQPGVRYAETEKYQVYSYVETNDPPSTSTWNKVGEVGSLRLPMACTFTQFKDGHRIFFAVRGVDTSGRLGSFNEPKSIDLRENVIVL
ncbi:hypothetical protein BIW11_08296 [Tropilaelaps mercedesae]|uniref:Activating transcription factor 7-interacting protein Fn3 domain-containing protein n=1 Tax=Tropilaelaps mercedesae TaxID=418985 RepID=A0A1V9XQF1_9ACAR|nr:hypothetical protein BIW11_08296 [Tropilaelaps mercedesae]